MGNNLNNRQEKKNKKLNICYIANTPYFFSSHLKSTIAAILREGHQLHLVCSEMPKLNFEFETPNLIIHIIKIERETALLNDLITITQLVRLLRKIKVDIVHSYTPKAGLLTSLTAFACRVPIRFHTFTGQTWANMDGVFRKILILADKIILNLNTKCYADSFAQIDLFKNNKLIKQKALHVLGNGSIAGVNKNIFDPFQWSDEDKKKIRSKLNLPEEAFVINFTGRLRIEKGLCDLLIAFKNLVRAHPRLYWIIVGPREMGSNKLPEAVWEELNSHPNIRMIGYYPIPTELYAISHIFCIPSYREGFGSVVIEAAMMKIPTVGANTIGLSEAIIENVTGLLVPPKDPISLELALDRLIRDSSLRLKLAENAYKRAIEHFNQEDVIQLVLSEYKNILN